QIAAANWKMNLSYSAALALVDELLSIAPDVTDNHLVILAVPFPYLDAVGKKLEGRKNIFVAAQNCASNNNGAYTGEVSAEMLSGMGIRYVILGHSERREYQVESN